MAASGTEHGIFVTPDGKEKESLNGVTNLGTDDASSTHSHEHVFKDEATAKYWRRSEEHTSEPSHSGESRMPSSA